MFYSNCYFLAYFIFEALCDFNLWMLLYKKMYLQQCDATIDLGINNKWMDDMKMF